MNQFGANPYLNQYNTYPQKFQYPVNNGINWVQGIEGAKAWQLQPNSNVVLLDSENDGRFYIKVSDNVGMCSLRIFDYNEITDTPTQQSDIDLSEYVKKSELQTLLASMLGGQRDEQSISAIDGKSKSLFAK